MFGSTVLEVGTALLFIFLTLSIVVSALNELVARIVGSRARFLREAVANMVSEGPDGVGLKRFYDHPVVRSLGRRRRRGGHTAPSYLPKRVFSRVLVDLLAEDGLATSPSADEIRAAARSLGGPQLEGAVAAIVRDTGADLLALRGELEQWFDDVMDRVGGWYARWSRQVGTVIALGLVVALNADAIELTNRLYTDADLRARAVAAAEHVVAQSAPPPPVDPSPDSTPTTADPPSQLIVSSARSLDVVLGWNDHAPVGPMGWLTKVLGLLLTAAATVMGAPFWFDLLGRIVRLRVTGMRPDSSPTPSRVE